jgi:hypothetical protein
MQDNNQTLDQMRQALRLPSQGPDDIEVPNVTGTKTFQRQVGQSDIDRDMAVRRSLSRLDDDARTPTPTDTPVPKTETVSNPIGTQTDDVDGAAHGSSDDAHVRALNENTRAVREQTEALRGGVTDGDDDADIDGDSDDKPPEKPKKKTRDAVNRGMYDSDKTSYYQVDREKGLGGRMAQYIKRQGAKTFADAKKEGFSGLSKEAGKIYAAGEVEAKVNKELKGDDTPPGPGGDPTAELKREARERAMEERALGVTRMYQDNVRALNPYAHS